MITVQVHPKSQSRGIRESRLEALGQGVQGLLRALEAEDANKQIHIQRIAAHLKIVQDLAREAGYR